MSPAAQWPSDLARRNQAILAERLHWPEGALQACADLEERYPGWHVSWRQANPHKGFERPAGFWASCSEYDHFAEAFRETAAELEKVLAAGKPRHSGPRPLQL